VVHLDGSIGRKLLRNISSLTFFCFH